MQSIGQDAATGNGLALLKKPCIASRCKVANPVNSLIANLEGWEGGELSLLHEINEGGKV